MALTNVLMPKPPIDDAMTLLLHLTSLRVVPSRLTICVGLVLLVPASIRIPPE